MVSTEYLWEALIITSAVVGGASLAVLWKNVADYLVSRDVVRHYQDPAFILDHYREATTERPRKRRHLWNFGLTVGEWLWYRSFLSRDRRSE